MSFITSQGVVGYSNQINRTAPNNALPVSYFIASGADVDIDAVIGPKGAGSLLAQIPTGTAVGGNKRGGFAVDFQQQRSTAAQVASGSSSTIAGGTQNTASGGLSSVLGGQLNVAAGTFSTVCGGVSNNCSGGGFIGGGSTNTASGVRSGVLSGANNAASGDFSTALGNSASTRANMGMVAACPSALVSLGDNQATWYQGNAFTNTAAPKRLTSNNAAAAATNVPVLPDNSIFKFVIDAVGFAAASGDYLVVKYEGVVIRGANAASTALVGVVTTPVASTAGAALWTLPLIADTALGGLDLTGTGAAATTIKWGFTAYCKEITG